MGEIMPVKPKEVNKKVVKKCCEIKDIEKLVSV
mgnify:CR=1 FL=1